MKTLLLFIVLNSPVMENGPLITDSFVSELSIKDIHIDTLEENTNLDDETVHQDSTRLALEKISKNAVLKSVLIPGWGQIYNARQWKQREREMRENGILTPKLWWVSVPIIYGGFIGSALAYDFNNRNYKWILGEVQYRLAKNDVPRDDELARINTPQLIRYKDAYRRDRDLSIQITVSANMYVIFISILSGTPLSY